MGLTRELEPVVYGIIWENRTGYGDINRSVSSPLLVRGVILEWENLQAE